MRSPFSRFAAVVLPCAVFCLASTAYAQQSPLDQVRQLRMALKFDEALKLLEELEEETSTDKEVLAVIPLERGSVLAAAGFAAKSAAKRMEYIHKADAALRKFLKEQPNHEEIDRCRRELGNVLTQQARHYVERAEQFAGEPAAKPLLEKALKRFTEARDHFDTSIAAIRQALQALPKVIPPGKAKLQARRNQLRRDYLQAQLLSAALLEESAETELNEAAKRQTLERAAQGFIKVYELYRTRLAGLYAHMYAGRCLRKAGKPREALGRLEEILEQPDDPEAFRMLKNVAVVIVVGCLVDMKRYDNALERGQDALNRQQSKMRPNDLAELHLVLAQACLGKVQQDAKLEKEAKEDLEQQALRYLALATQGSPSTRRQARALMVRSIAKEGPDTFDQALAAGMAAMTRLQGRVEALKELDGKITREREEAIVQRLKEQRDELRSVVERARAEATRYLEHALRKFDDNTKVSSINRVNYLLGYLSYRQEDYERASSYTRPVARQHPKDLVASSCAKIHLACLVHRYRGSAGEERKAVLPELVNFADYTLLTWPKKTVAVDACRTLIPVMQAAGRPEQARFYQERLEELTK